MDISCRVCGEPYSCRGLHWSTSDLSWVEFYRFLAGQGCPCCHGTPTGKGPDQDQEDRWANSCIRASEGCAYDWQASQVGQGLPWGVWAGDDHRVFEVALEGWGARPTGVDSDRARYLQGLDQFQLQHEYRIHVSTVHKLGDQEVDRHLNQGDMYLVVPWLDFPNASTHSPVEIKAEEKASLALGAEACFWIGQEVFIPVGALGPRHPLSGRFSPSDLGSYLDGLDDLTSCGGVDYQTLLDRDLLRQTEEYQAALEELVGEAQEAQEVEWVEEIQEEVEEFLQISGSLLNHSWLQSMVREQTNQGLERPGPNEVLLEIARELEHAPLGWTLLRSHLDRDVFLLAPSATLLGGDTRGHLDGYLVQRGVVTWGSLPTEELVRDCFGQLDRSAFRDLRATDRVSLLLSLQEG